jgi:hypothetical protein
MPSVERATLFAADHPRSPGNAARSLMAGCAAMRNQTLSSWPSAELSLLGGMALASLAAAGIWLVLGPAPDVADHLIAIGLLIALFLAALIVLHLVRNTRKTNASRAREPHRVRTAGDGGSPPERGAMEGGLRA